MPEPGLLEILIRCQGLRSPSGRSAQFVRSIGAHCDTPLYVYVVPFVEDQALVFLKTIIPSRKATKRYLGKEPDDHEA